MRAAIIESGTVTNVIEVDSLDALPDLIDGTDAAIGDQWDGMQFIKPAPPAPTVPDSVPMLNAQLTLIDAGLFDAVDAYFASLTGIEGAKARAYWMKAPNMRRDDPLVETMRLQLGKTQAEIDALFIDAQARG